MKKTAASNTTLCLIDTQTHALAARAMRLSLAAMDFADALFISDLAEDMGGARHVAIAPLAGRAAYSRFVMKDLLQHIETEHVLLIQWDGYVVNSAAWSDDFLDHDYIGARWGFHKDAHSVGNGGFSLRSRRLLEALQDPAIDRFEPEDEMICRHYRPLLESRYGVRFAPPGVADRFSFETTYPQTRTLGFHGLFNMWLFVGDAEIPDLVAAMPEPVITSVQYLSLAKNLVDLKRFEPARFMLERRLQSHPDDAAAARLLALAKPIAPAAPSRNAPCPCGSGKRYKHCCGQAGQTAAPATAESLLAEALSHHQAGRLDDARRAYLVVLARGPHAVAEHYLGVLDMQAGRPQDGERRIRTSLSMRSDVPDFYNNLGLSLRAQGRLDEAVAEYRRAIELDPAYAPAWSNLGLDLHKLGDLDEALAAYDRALALDARFAQARFGRALVLLTRGDYTNGWAEYEWRMKCAEYAAGYRLPAAVTAPHWQGEPLAGKHVLLIAEQGIGDSIQFVRYAESLAGQGARVSLFVHKAGLARLLVSAPGIDGVFTGADPVPAVDYHCHMLSLPHRLGTTTLDVIPNRVPYLTPPPDQRAAWQGRLAALPGRLRVGLAWAGNPANPDDRYRSCPFEALAPLLDIPGIDWINLQLGAARADIERIPNPVHDWGDEQTDFAQTAALIKELDLVISVDTAIAHAAGALCVPVWILLQESADFRWLTDRSDSPWYPSARLFRQANMGDWPSVAKAVRHAIDAFAA